MPHLCQYVGAFQDSKQIYIVMEHAADGDLLEALLREGRAMTEARAVREVGGLEAAAMGLPRKGARWGVAPAGGAGWTKRGGALVLSR